MRQPSQEEDCRIFNSLLDEKLNEISIDTDNISYKEVKLVLVGKIKFNNEFIKVGEKSKKWKYEY